jgi:hypothetical protein
LGNVVVLEEKWPVLGRHERAAEWLRLWTDLGRAPRTIDAYARGLAEYLLICERDGVDPATAGRLHVAVFVKDLSTRPSRRGINVVALDSGAGLANATLQQRLVPVRPRRPACCCLSHPYERWEACPEGRGARVAERGAAS